MRANILSRDEENEENDRKSILVELSSVIY